MADVRDPRLLGHDAFLGHTEYFHFDPDTDAFTIETVQDCASLIEVNQALSNDAPLRWGEFTHVASLPSVIVTQLINDGILAGPGHVRDPERFRTFLNDRDQRVWRTRPGVV